VVDIDGVLADARHRQHYLESRWQDWDSFFLAAGDDGLLEEQARLLEMISTDHVIALVTARSDWIDGITLKWIHQHGIRWDLLIMRASGDYRRSTAMKQHAVEQLRSRNYEPVLAIDDDPRNVKMFESLGIPTIFIPSGYHGSARQ
jgi:uncharacterized HAD superfamily protein